MEFKVNDRTNKKQTNKKNILLLSFITLAFSSLYGCTKGDWTSTSIKLRNRTNDTIQYTGTIYRVNTVNTTFSNNSVDVLIPPYDEIELIYYQTDELPSKKPCQEKILQIINKYDYGRITFKDSSFVDYLKGCNYPKSPYTQLDFYEDHPNGTIYAYGYKIDEADHQWALEYSKQP